MNTSQQPATWLGIDIGTSACRICLIDEQGHILAQTRQDLPPSRQQGNEVEQDPVDWWQALDTCLSELGQQYPLQNLQAIALDGTSATLLLCDAQGTVLSPALMYNDQRAQQQAAQIQALAANHNTAANAFSSPTSSLAKLLWLIQHDKPITPFKALHQADWLTGHLCGEFHHSDANNSLKLGYDSTLSSWNNLLFIIGIDKDNLPDIHLPGQTIKRILPTLAKRCNINPKCQIKAGTTDSTAAFIATGSCQLGDAVTALGSTLVIKILSDQPVFASDYGVYSHRLGDQWLVGGASNSGGNVLSQFFNNNEIQRLSQLIDPQQPCGLDYYPLPSVGERFPHNNSHKQPQLEPRPADDYLFLQGMFEGIADIEYQGYRRLEQLGTPYPKRIQTIGGGANNKIWQQIRSQRLGIPVQPAKQQEAAYGAALLAKK
ncbi:MAG: FGGY-family carbohydrate kinase [Gammaproteobacteria bacterium]|nr:FGGY-family carbohydrate kinase [Gammaproteobacteria bacterium]